MVDRSRMLVELMMHEGLRLRPYLDTEKNWSLGIGYNLTARGVESFERVIGRRLGIQGPNYTSAADVCSALEAEQVCLADVDRVEAAVRAAFPDYEALSEVRQRVVVDMTFNMGASVLQFTRAIAALKKRDWSEVAKQLHRSKWARQVGDGEGGRFDRADRLALMMLTGEDYTR